MKLRWFLLLHTLITGKITDSRYSQSSHQEGVNMPQVKLMVLYPQPTDSQQFDQDYQAHLQLFHQKMSIPADQRPYTVTKMIAPPVGTSPYYQMFSFTFPSAEALEQTLATTQMQEIAADASRISTGGAPVMLIGNEEN